MWQLWIDELGAQEFRQVSSLAGTGSLYQSPVGAAPVLQESISPLESKRSRLLVGVSHDHDSIAPQVSRSSNSSSSRIRQSTKMATSNAAILTILLVVYFVSGVVGSIDGRPRPAHFPDAPTTEYGPEPVIYDNTISSPIDCSWYGWANENFPANTGAACLTVLRKALTNSTVNPPSTMEAYRYYTLKRLIDATTNEAYCYIGCFKLAGTSSSAGSPPPMVDSPPASIPAPSTNAPPPYSSTPAGSVSPAPVGDGLPRTGSDNPAFGPGPAGGPLTSPPSSSAVHLHPSRLFSIAFLGVALILSLFFTRA